MRNDHNNPKKLLVVGGGSAGWLAAAYLDARLNRGGHRRIDISVVESPDVPRIGVGEATIPSINHILDVVGLDENEFLRRTDGTFKQAIKFINWRENRGEAFYHPFNRFRESPVDHTTRRWLRSDRSVPFAATVSVQPGLCDANLAPKTIGQWNYGAPLSYAFHMNALKFADCLRDIATSRGVQHYPDHVVEVEKHECGDIAAVRTRSELRLEADLFIDCTGFRARLIEEELGVGWVDFSKWLLCDRAVVMPVDYATHYPGFVRPYTMSTALSAGWVWDIPLQNRRGVGYVHSSQFIDVAAAERELRAYEGPHAEALDTRVVEFRVGMREKTWHRNCIAIGLASGFLEPLESTGIYLGELAAVMLAEHFPDGDDVASIAFRFNRIMANRYHEILDFINLHYCLTRRTDTAFWREVQQPERLNSRLQAKLDFWRHKAPSASDFEDMHMPGEPNRPIRSGGHARGDDRSPVDTAALFGLDSYEHILYGMDFLREECDAWFGTNRPGSSVAPLVAQRLSAAPGTLSPHDVWLRTAIGARVGSERHR